MPAKLRVLVALVSPLCDGVVQLEGQELVEVNEIEQVVPYAVVESCDGSEGNTEAPSQAVRRPM